MDLISKKATIDAIRAWAELDDFPKCPLICRKCKEAILWARGKIEEQHDD